MSEDIVSVLQDGWTPLHLAVQSRRTDVVRLLLIKGADKTIKNQVRLIWICYIAQSFQGISLLPVFLVLQIATQLFL